MAEHDYLTGYREFSWPRPERFNFARDVVDVWAERVVARVAQLDGPTADATALLIDHADQRVEHVGRVADIDSEADVDQILELLTDVVDLHGVGVDAGFGRLAIGGFVVRMAEGVQGLEGV